METNRSGIEAVTVDDVLNLATWERARTTDELRSFIARRAAALDDLGVELDEA